MGNVDNSLDLLSQAQQHIDLQAPGLSHSCGEELLIAAALLHTRNPQDVRYRKRFESSLDAYRSWLLGLNHEDGQSLHPTLQDRIAEFTRWMQLEFFSALETDSRWREIRLLAQGLLH
jgi:hypothetical protein